MAIKENLFFISIVLSCLFYRPTLLQAQSKYAAKDWQLLDLEKDSVYGTSVTKAYSELLKNRKSHSVIVAVIDVGVDISQQDLQNHIWINKNEIPSNGIDDDDNGYIDDVHGWNFLGNANGENLVDGSFESAREYLRLKPLFYDVIDSTNVAEKDRKKYKQWLLLESMHIKDSSVYGKQIKLLSEQLKSFHHIDSLLHTIIQKDSLHESDLEQLISVKDVPQNLKDSANAVFTNYVGPFNSLENYIAQKEKTLNRFSIKQNFVLHPEDQRKKIVQDDPYNLQDKNYGNNNVAAGITDHGTHIAGIIAAIRNNNFGMDGIADNVVIMPIRASCNCDERDKDVALAIRYAVDNGASIINMSFGKYFSPQKTWVDEAIKYAADHNVLLVHGAGNDSSNNDLVPFYPIASPDNSQNKNDNFITLGASTAGPGNLLVVNFSNYGQKEVDLFAPGQNIYSSISRNKFEKMSGTSMASPVVAGIAALILEYYPKLSAPQLKMILMQSVKKFPGLMVQLPGTKKQVPFSSLSKSEGLVNAYNALKLAATIKGERTVLPRK